jgi:hypothetical protein
MKKLLGIVVLTSLCLIAFANIDYAESAKCKKNQIFKDGRCQFDYGKYFEDSKKKNKRKKFFKNITGLTYFEKRKECKEWADRGDTVYDGKRRYKSCMKGE